MVDMSLAELTMMQKELIGQCGLYIWTPDSKPIEWIFPEDYTSFSAQHSFGRVYHCIGFDSDYIIIKSNRVENGYRVDLKGFVPVASTDHYVGDQVIVLVGSQMGLQGEICGMGWHTCHKKIIFILKINGKKRSRWYYEEDIILCESIEYEG